MPPDEEVKAQHIEGNLADIYHFATASKLASDIFDKHALKKVREGVNSWCAHSLSQVAALIGVESLKQWAVDKMLVLLVSGGPWPKPPAIRALADLSAIGKGTSLHFSQRKSLASVQSLVAKVPFGEIIFDGFQKRGTLVGLTRDTV